MRLVTKTAAALFAIVLCACSGDEGNEGLPVPFEDSKVRLEQAFPQLSFQSPLDLQSPDDGTNRIFVVEQSGIVKVFPNSQQTADVKTYLDIRDRTSTSSGELGLLGIAFHPDYASNGYFYVNYTPSAQESVVARFKVSDTDVDRADPESETVLLSIPQPFTNHNGGQLVFGPDGFLYIASGDGGSGGDPLGNAQNLSSLLGKVLRIDVNISENNLPYGIPPGNPFVSEPDARPEIYAYGLRNPWRMSFDTQTGRLWAGDVGQGQVEEIDLIEAGGNYGWNILEGSRCFTAPCDGGGFTGPLYEYDHSNGDKSVTGGYVYRGNEVPSLRGYYIFADFISGRIWALPANEPAPDAYLLETSGLGISSFGTDSGEALYLCSFDGNIYHFVEE